MPTKTKQATRFRPLSYHSLMVQLDTLEQLVTVSSPDGFSLQASYIHLRSGSVEHSTTFKLTGRVTFYFVASEFAGWYYILRYFENLNAFGCSCREGKQGHNCEHMKLMPEHV